MLPPYETACPKSAQGVACHVNDVLIARQAIHVNDVLTADNYQLQITSYYLRFSQVLLPIRPPRHLAAAGLEYPARADHVHAAHGHIRALVDAQPHGIANGLAL